MLSRRNFLTHTCELGIAAATISSTSLSLGLAQRASATNGSRYHALVCVLLAGGNDCYNMVVPNDQDQLDEYRAMRSGIALDTSSLLPLPGTTEAGRHYAIHPGMPEVVDLYTRGELAVVSNVGTLIGPMDAQAVEAGIAPRVPPGLFSHSDQIAQWQTSLSGGQRSQGWAGRIVDLYGLNTDNGIPTNISLSGSNLFQSSHNVVPHCICAEGDGSQKAFMNGDSNYGPFHKRQVDGTLDVVHDHLLRREYSLRVRAAIKTQEEFVGAIRTSPEIQTDFPDHHFSKSLRQIARIIAARKAFGANRQTFFVRVGGWDHHDEVLNNQAKMLTWISAGMGSFRDAMVELGTFNDVTLFTISDFGRTLTPNGKGSDHGWGGHHFVMGGDVKGGQMYGDYPLIAKNSPLDVGRGVYVPTTAVEEYFSELALWFGVSPSDLDYIFPNVRRFYSPESRKAPMGFMS